MVFSSVTFLFYFLPIALALYFVAPFGMKNGILLIASLFFYAWGEPIYIFLMLFSVIANYLLGLALDRTRDRKRLVLVASIVLNLGLLGFFKYANFAIATVNGLAGTAIATVDLPLPIGISFYTFQAISYLVDLYKGEVGPQKNFINFAAYIALFPQLVAGPIVRLQTVEQSFIRREHTFENFAAGSARFIIGLAKKVLIANQMGQIWDTVSAADPASLSVATAWIGIVAFTFQIYFDFSGYSDMAIGLGRIFGFRYNENFRFPYSASSITEFWRRWHMSLSSWFRDYVYIPLGGNRKGLAVQLRNILIVWLLTGLWHGASWNFVFWGLYFAVILTAEKLFLLKKLERCSSIFRHLYTMLLVIVSWVIFSVGSVNGILGYIGVMFGFGSGGLVGTDSIYLLGGNALLFLAACIFASERSERIRPRGIIALTLLLIVCICFIMSSTYNPFVFQILGAG